jgi:hypothetical protein
MNHVMIDIEALRLHQVWKAPIMQIGMVLFSQKGVVIDTKNIFIEQESMPSHFEPEINTVNWWKEQEGWDNMQESITSFGIPLAGALSIASQQINRWGNKATWFAGPTYDQVALEGAMSFCGINYPWAYNQSRDFRTIRKQYPELAAGMPENHMLHDALSDALNQVAKLEYITNKTGHLWK